MANGEAGSGPFWGKPEWRGEEGYYKMLASSFGNLLASGEKIKTRTREEAAVLTVFFQLKSVSPGWMCFERTLYEKCEK